MKHKRIKDIEIIIPLLLLLTPLRAITIVLLPFVLCYISTKFPSFGNINIILFKYIIKCHNFIITTSFKLNIFCFIIWY